MTDTKALREVIEETGIKITFLAQKIGISRECFYQKMRNETEFKASEIKALAKVLHLSAERRDAIFFS